VTFQAYASADNFGPDYYDVSIINGVNFAIEFGPTNVPVSTASAYSCGMAGSVAAQNGGYTTANPTGLPAASWTMKPSRSSFPVGTTPLEHPESYFRAVIPPAGTSTTCTRDSDCTSIPGTTCGYAMSNFGTGTFDFATRTCGKAVAWLTADAVWGFNQSSTNAAPFAFSTSWDNGNGGTVSVGDLQLCVNNTYSAYVNNGTATTFPVQPVALACGGVMWGATEVPGPLQNPSGNAGLGLTPPTQPVQTANANWLDYVLPTIGWLKQACPTCYTYPFDDMSSTFTCANTTVHTKTTYGVTFSDLN
jgi:hypothetical protein